MEYILFDKIRHRGGERRKKTSLHLDDNFLDLNLLEVLRYTSGSMSEPDKPLLVSYREYYKTRPDDEKRKTTLAYLTLDVAEMEYITDRAKLLGCSFAMYVNLCCLKFQLANINDLEDEHGACVLLMAGKIDESEYKKILYDWFDSCKATNTMCEVIDTTCEVIATTQRITNN